MDEAHEARLCVEDPSRAFPEVISRAFESEYVRCFAQLEVPSEAAISGFCALIARCPQLYESFSQVRGASASQRLLAAANYASNPGFFPELSSLIALAGNSAAFALMERLLAKDERDLLQYRHDLFAFSELLNYKTKDALPYLKQLLARARFGTRQPLPLFLLRKLLPRKFEEVKIRELEDLVFQIYREVCETTFDVTTIVFNLFYFENLSTILQWAVFRVDLHIFANIKPSVKMLLFLAIKMDKETPETMAKVLKKKMLKLLPPARHIQLDYDPYTVKWQEHLIVNADDLQIQEVQLFMLKKIAQVYELSGALISFNQVQQFCKHNEVDSNYTNDLKRYYAENGNILLFWHSQHFNVCLSALFNMNGDALQALQLIYMALVGRDFSYYILSKDQYVAPSLFAAAKIYSDNIEEGVFLAQCNAEQRENYKAISTLEFLIPVHREAKHVALKVLYALNQLKTGSAEAFEGIFKYLLEYSEPQEIIFQAQKHKLQIKLPTQYFELSRLNKKIIVGVLEAFEPHLKDPRIDMLIELFLAKNTRGNTLLDNTKRVLFHPKLQFEICENYELLKLAASNESLEDARSLLFPLQISEHVQEPNEQYIICNGIMFALLLFTGDFETQLQIELAKIIWHLLHVSKSEKALYSAAFQTVVYDEQEFYAKYVGRDEVLGNLELLANRIDMYCINLKKLVFPIVTGHALFELIKQTLKSSKFNFGAELYFETNYAELHDATEKEVCHFLEKQPFPNLGAFPERGFTLPSIFGQRLLFTNTPLDGYANIIKVRYEEEELYEMLRPRLESKFPALDKLLSMEYTPEGEKRLIVLLNSNIQAVWRELESINDESELNALAADPYRLMRRSEWSCRYAEILSLLKRCEIPGLCNIQFE